MNIQSVSDCSTKQVAIAYQYLAHYRITIARAICVQTEDENLEYTWISGTTQGNDQSSLKTIDTKWKSIDLADGGFRWKIIKNFWLSKSILWQHELIKISYRKDFDCIIYLGDMHYLSTWLCATISRLRGKRVLMWSHGFYGNESDFKSLLRKSFFKLSDGVLLYGNHARKLMIDMGFDSSKLYVVYNSLDYESQRKHRVNTTDKEISDMKVKLFAQPTLPVIIFSGRIIKSKGLGLLLKAISIARSKNALVNLLIVGDGPDRNNLADSVKQLDLDQNTSFYGECYSEKELAVVFGLSDICVSPEGVGLTAMHAMAYGVPVITHDQPTLQKPEFEAIFPGKTGDFFKKGDPESLAQCILDWVTKSQSDSSISVNCIKVIENLYNANTQTNIINLAVQGQSADEVLRNYGPNRVDFI